MKRSRLQRKVGMTRTALSRNKRVSDHLTEKRNLTRRVTLKVKRKTVSKLSEWSKQVRANAPNGLCQRCGSVGHHAHHRAPRSRRPDLRLVVANGVWCCWKCHEHIHSHPIESVRDGWLSVEAYEVRGDAEMRAA